MGVCIIFLFMRQDSLDKFRHSQGWSVVAFVMTNVGLMANLTLEGTKITRLKQSPVQPTRSAVKN